MSDQQDQKSKKQAASFDVNRALTRALGGGLAGASAMVVQVVTLMPMRTVMNYQYRHGGQMTDTIKLLYNEGKVVRFYRGILPALLQGPLSRFGDTAANSGILSLLNSSSTTKDLPVAVKTIAASAAAASFRIVLTPIDTVKTTMQTAGKEGMALLRNRIKTAGPQTLWYGAVATATATFVGHYPWFATYNQLQESLPKFGDGMGAKFARNAVIGFTSSVVSDSISNSLRVIKTYRQTHPEKVSYTRAINEVIAKDGLIGLFGRGLKTRILANGLQGIMFSVLWKLIEEKISPIKK